MKDLLYGPTKLSASNYYGFYFGVATLPKNNEIEIYNRFHTCREGLIGEIYKNLDKINTDKTHMLLKWDSGATDDQKQVDNDLANQRWIEDSIKLLHIYESIAKWPLTKPYRVKTENGDRTKLYYFLSSRRWIKAPYLMSLYVLMIRLCRNELFTDFKTHDDLIKIGKTVSNKGKAYISNDERHFIDTFKYWTTFITHYADLCRQRKIEYYWSPERLAPDNSVSYEGITNLSKGYTTNKDLYNKLVAFHKEEGRKTK